MGVVTIDMAGRNHKGSQVAVRLSDMLDIFEKGIVLKKRLISE